MARVVTLAVLALFVGATLVPTVGATHEGELLFEKVYQWYPLEDDRDFFDVPPTSPDHDVVCYKRETSTATQGVWTAVVYDGRDLPVIVDTTVDGGSFTPGVHVSFPVGSGVVGTWTIDVHAAGQSSYQKVTITYVASVDDCTFDH